MERDYVNLQMNMAIFHEDRLIAGVCTPKSASVYLDILESFRSVAWHVRKILQEFFCRVEVRITKSISRD